MKKNFKITKKSSFVKVDGKKIYLCCASCVSKFEADPEKYLKECEKEEKANCAKKKEE